MKPLFDRLIALLSLILLSPLLVLAAVFIKLDTSGPIIFSHRRIGLAGKPFQLYKFRSMTCDPTNSGSFQTRKNDPRITRSGRLLRSSSLDEIPQLVNVLKGDMSLVGPRPDVAAQEKDYRPEDWQKRLSVKPGITGLAQVNGRSDCSFEERLGYDIEYVDTAGLLLDLEILWKTVRVILSRKGGN